MQSQKSLASSLPVQGEEDAPTLAHRLRRSLGAPGILFWLGFLAFNVVLFLPAYLFNLADAAFLPEGGLE
jgi:hypothetical protein